MNVKPQSFDVVRLPQPETSHLDFLAADPALTSLLALYMAPDELVHMRPHFARLGSLLGGPLDDLARAADKAPPTLEPRDRQGRDRQRVAKHPAYIEMERLAYGTLEMAALSHRPALGWPRPPSAFTKYALVYLFAQSEFGLLCPVNMTDSLTRTIRRHASQELLDRFLPRLLEQDIDRLWQGAMFMTERFAGSDVGVTETRAVRAGEHWLLSGDKWFCSNADAGLALVLARPEGAGEGLKGLSLFLMPRDLDDGSPNRYRIVRLKDKLGTRAMPSGEIRLEGAVAYLVGQPGQGFQQIAEMVNQSRLANGVRAAGLMRRAVHEAMAVALGREAFGRRLIDLPLARRQLVKMILPAECALSVAMLTADRLEKADQGDAKAQQLRRILTPLLKLRACRDARKVTGDAMEMRGGCGYVEEFIEPRLLREAHLGSIWEGTSNIIALDVVRAAKKEGAHRALAEHLAPMIAAAPGNLARTLSERLATALARIEQAASGGSEDRLARQAAGGLYYVTAAALLVHEAKAAGRPERVDMAHLVLTHMLAPRDPLAVDTEADEAAANRVIDALASAHRQAQIGARM